MGDAGLRGHYGLAFTPVIAADSQAGTPCVLRALTDAGHAEWRLLLALFGHQGQLDWLDKCHHALPGHPIASLWLMLLIYAGPALLLLLT